MRWIFVLEELSHGKDEQLEAPTVALFEKAIPRLLRPLEIKPYLIHSGLWPGNSMPGAKTGEMMIFDIYAFWGQNEVDLGSWRALRYKPGRPFLEEYQNIIGISEPQEDWDDRNALFPMHLGSNFAKWP